MRVTIPEPLLSYTDRRREVEAEGKTLADLLDDLDRRFPGIRHRIVDEQDSMRPHVRFFVNRDRVHTLDTPLAPTDEVHIFQALSGG